MPKIWRKLTLRPNLCYSATSEKNWLREEDRLGDFTRREKSPKPFFERRGQSCRIISVNMPYYRIGRCIRVRKSEFDVWVKQFRNGTSNDLDAIWDQVMKEV